MSAPSSTAIFRKPVVSFSPTTSFRFNSLWSFSIHRLSLSKSVFPGGFPGGLVANKLVLGRNRVRSPITMTEFVRASAFSGKNGDDGIGAFEQEAFIDGSSDFAVNRLESTLNRLSKWLITGLFGFVILWRHDAEALWAAAGSIINAALSIILKKILNQERPTSASSSGPGMPSSHAQSIFYSIFFAILSLVQWRGVNELTVIISVIILTFGSYLAWLRVSQQFHTVSQVLVGAIVGSAFLILWFWSWDALVAQAFESSIWVRIFILSGAVGCWIVFLLYVIRYWFKDER